MPVDLNRLTEGWLELESDPGLFTLLLEDFGVRGVQVEEIYDLQKPIEGPVYGFIFLFKWIEERRSRRKVVVIEESFVEDEKVVNSIFFAQQMVPNSCATHALLSVLLNCSKIHLGPTLTRLKEHTANMSPDNKGYAIGNTPELARAHNSHAKPEPRHLHEKSHGISTGRTMEAFHFVSYVPIRGRLFELDGLKPFPIDHGPWAEGEDWTEKFRRVMTERLGIATGGEPYHDIRFNLMAVVPDRRIAYEQKLRTLKTNRQIVLEALQQLVKLTHPELTSDDHAVYMSAMKKERNQCKTDSDDSTQQSSVSSSSKQKSSSNSSLPSSGASPYPKLPPALDSHNYAKSPLMEGVFAESSGSQPRYEDYSDSDYTDDESSPSGSRQKSKSDNISSHSKDSIEDISAQNIPPNWQEKTDSKPTIQEPDESSEMGPLTINTSSDIMRPLTIQTKFQPSPTPSASSTDTSSEAGSAFNSPVRSVHYSFAQGSPNSVGKMGRNMENCLFEDVRDIKRFVVIRVTSGPGGCIGDKEDVLSKADKAETSEKTKNSNTCSQDLMVDSGKKSLATEVCASTADEPPTKRICVKDINEVSSSQPHDISDSSNVSDQNEKEKSSKISCANSGKQINDGIQAPSQSDDSISAKSSSKCGSSKHPHLIEPHKFAPKDLLALLKTVENEISVCESNLRDEIEKRKKYKVDDCRRTHNYDQFICTFLSMLADKGKLADLVEQQLLVRRRQGIRVGRLHKTKKPDRRRKSRPKKKK